MECLSTSQSTHECLATGEHHDSSKQGDATDRVNDPIVRHYEQCLAKHRYGHLAVDWPNAADVVKRFEVMTQLFLGQGGSILDFGCGVGLYYDYLRQHHPEYSAHYTALDISDPFIARFQEKFPGVPALCQDVLDTPLAQAYDFVVMNGVFTIKRTLPWETMWQYMQQTIAAVWPFTNKGLVFNVMSDQVQWSRLDLFHLPFDVFEHWVHEVLECTVERIGEYGLYEYSVYVRHKIKRGSMIFSGRWSG